jgi:hypothetical protein
MNSIADISVFENIQNQANMLMNISSLSVFNATFRIEDQKKAKENKQKIEARKSVFIEEEKFLIRTKLEYKKKKVEFEKLKKEGQTPRKLMVDLADLRTKRIGSRANLQHGIKEFRKWGIIATSTELNED